MKIKENIKRNIYHNISDKARLETFAINLSIFNTVKRGIQLPLYLYMFAILSFILLKNSIYIEDESYENK